MKIFFCLALLLTSCTPSSIFMIEEVAQAALEEAVVLQKTSEVK